ncbi:hypothetical protein [Oligella urethralis]|uniref:hypothetical protein n=1 Tax=Oligella urethralis TaxID=90245 RepID=UPI002430CE86|nr:hypothetical protein [Oligella urethralis]
MPLETNFNIKSLRLIPFWGFIITAPAVVLSIFVLPIYYFLSESKDIPGELVLIMGLSGCVISYLLMKYYPSFARKAIIAYVSVWTVLYAGGMTIPPLLASLATLNVIAILLNLLITLVVFAVLGFISFIITRYALTPREVQRQWLFFF